MNIAGQIFGVARRLVTTFFDGLEKTTAARTEDRLLVDDPLLAMGALHASIVGKNPAPSRMLSAKHLERSRPGALTL